MPVFPATWMPGICALVPVPLWTAATIIVVSSAAVCGLIARPRFDGLVVRTVEPVLRESGKQVDRDAREGRDYHLDKLLPFWQLTSEQDWQICERQQRGVNSSAYQPGPYSTFKEHNVDSFVRWYLQMLKLEANCAKAMVA